MSGERSARRLVRLYPRAWRERYGRELEALIVESSGGRPAGWRTRADVTLAAVREHAHRLTPGGDPAAERSRAGMLLALWAWMLFVCAGTAVQKVSEHWQGSVPNSRRALPSASFDVLLAGAAAGGIIVLAGLALVLPSAWSLLRAGRARELRVSLVRSGSATLVTLAAGTAITVWAHHLTASQRDGHDAAYSAAFAALALLVAICLATWAATAGAVLRRLELSARVVRAEAGLACALTVAMAAMTGATLVWWRAVASTAPTTLAHEAVLLGAAVGAMLFATVTAAAGARVALLASRATES